MPQNQHIPGIATLCYLLDKPKGKVLMGTKKYGGAKGKYNGFGGKVDISDNSLKEAVVREFEEETGVVIEDPLLQNIVTITNIESNPEKVDKIDIYVYKATKWNGYPEESKEMTVRWISLNSIPFEKMWENDKLWFNAIMTDMGSRILVKSIDGELQEVNIDFQAELNEDIPKKA